MFSLWPRPRQATVPAPIRLWNMLNYGPNALSAELAEMRELRGRTFNSSFRSANPALFPRALGPPPKLKVFADRNVPSSTPCCCGEGFRARGRSLPLQISGTRRNHMILRELCRVLRTGRLLMSIEISPLQSIPSKTSRETRGGRSDLSKRSYFKKRSGLIAICSKNDQAPTKERFQRIRGDRIRLDDFVSVKINWSPKSENISEILTEANLLPESAVFIDDSPREIDKVRARFPSIRCLGGKPS